MNIASLLPFLGKEEVDKLLDKKLSQDSINVKELTMFLPFASRSKLDNTLIQLYHNDKIPTNKLAAFFPFVSNNALHQLVVEYTQNGKIRLPDSIVPFLSSSDVKLLFEYELEHESDNKGEQCEEDSKDDSSGVAGDEWVDFAEQMANIGKAFIPNIDKIIKQNKGKVTVHISKDGKDYDEADFDEDEETIEDSEDALEDLSDALDDVGDALEDVDCSIADIDSTLINEKSKQKLVSLKEKMTAELLRIQSLLDEE